MSDIESIISEEISVHTDVSEVYNPEAAETDDYYDDFEEASVTGAGSQPLPVSSRAPAPSVATAKTMLSGPTTKQPISQLQKDLPNIKNISVIKSEPSYEYSSGFDDDYENDFDSYNNDFEEDDENEKKPEKKTTFSAGTIGGTGASPTVPTITVGGANIPVPMIPLVQLPQTDSQALQAELALQEISKEVVRLRNQQRTLLQERRQVAREKILRAEARRTQYLAELKLLKDRAIEAEAKTVVLNDTVESLSRELEIVQGSKESLRQSIASLENTAKELNEKVLDLQVQLESSRKDGVAKDQEMSEKEKQWEEERKSLNQEIARHLLRVEVGEKSIDSNNERWYLMHCVFSIVSLHSEYCFHIFVHYILHLRHDTAFGRLARERERLPAEHQRRLDDALARYEALEHSLKEREGALRAEETRRLTDLELKVRQNAEEAARVRRRFDDEMAEERLVNCNDDCCVFIEF